MKLPWISREAHEAIVAGKEEHINALEFRLSSRETEYHALLDRVLNPPVPVVPLPLAQLMPEKRAASVIDDVIRLQGNGDMQLAKYLRKRARVLKGEHPMWTDAQIATELSRWETAEEMPPEFLIGEAVGE